MDLKEAKKINTANIPYSEIDKLWIPAVKILNNDLLIITGGCCQGHPGAKYHNGNINHPQAELALILDFKSWMKIQQSLSSQGYVYKPVRGIYYSHNSWVKTFGESNVVFNKRTEGQLGLWPLMSAYDIWIMPATERAAKPQNWSNTVKVGVKAAVSTLKAYRNRYPVNKEAYIKVANKLKDER
jgi:hypothetical protein